ncbi:Lsr2 dimerization domain-containing protein [Microbacterium maritypicum]|uniref:Lsr2 dimerization domain-containing protein n=1 Tax=Microbacterium maritypicum MF109 TaxID=1333857 RepID=T5KIQ5_MICMQ|nr:histone-like nucleoid-structuring protein Lsr2 [Microbacterium liquefaciens]EQM78197.1 hypothetical protein L687_16860 [Microbacterium maritypicum MF109]
MATKTIRVDDFDGKTEEGVKAVTFSVDGERYTIDLGPESLAALKDAVKPFVKKATKVAASGNYKKGTRPGILAWAKEKGLVEPTHRGRMPQTVIEAYDQEH